MRSRLPALAAAAPIVGALLAGPARAQDLTLESHPTRWRVTIESFDAGDDNHLGLAGAHIDLLDVWPGVVPGAYAGLGGQAAVTGTTGGLFYGGVTLGWLRELYPGWSLDLGLLVGAGGGGGADTGNGLALRPHLAVERAFGLAAVRLELAHLDFVGGDIESTHLALGLSLPGEILEAQQGRPPELIPPGELLWRRLRITPTYARVHPSSGSEADGGGDLDDVELAGVELDYFLGEHWYLPVEVQAAVGGNSGGFLMGMTGLGASWPLSPPGLSLDGKLEVGAGGGGNVDTGGGFLAGAQAGLAWALLSDVSVQLLGGYLTAPDGDFDGPSVSAGLSWMPRAAELDFGYPRESLARQGVSGSVARLDPLRIQLLHKSYFPSSDAEKTNGEDLDEDIQLIGLGVQRPIGLFHQDFAVTAAAFGAWEGDVGGYAEGLLGLQYELAPFANARFHTVTLRGEVGAGGGGDVDVGPGLIYTLNAGWRFQYSRDLALNLNVGSVEADVGSFHAESFTIGVSYVLNRAILH
jgi:hypothetical protein